MNTLRAHPMRRERGMTMLLVLVLLGVVLMGGLALARVSEVGRLAAGNASYREISLTASELGLNTAYAQVAAITNEEVAAGSWYLPTMQTTDSRSIPNVDWGAAPELSTMNGTYLVKYFVDRMCTTAPLTDAMRQCLVKEQPDPNGTRQLLPDGSMMDPPNARQFRVTVRVRGPKNTEIWVQALLTKAS